MNKELENIHYISTENDEAKIEYIGIYHLLDILMEKIASEKDTDRLKELIKLYKTIYMLVKDKGED